MLARINIVMYIIFMNNTRLNCTLYLYYLYLYYSIINLYLIFFCITKLLFVHNIILADEKKKWRSYQLLIYFIIYIEAVRLKSIIIVMFERRHYISRAWNFFIFFPCFLYSLSVNFTATNLHNVTYLYVELCSREHIIHTKKIKPILNY